MMILSTDLNEWLTKLKISRKVLVVWTIYVGISIVLLIIIAFPSWHHFLKMRKEKATLQKKLAAYRLKYNQLVNIDNQQLDIKVKRSLEFLPLYHNAPLIIGILSNVGSEYSVSLGNVNFSPGKVASDSLTLVSKQKKTSKSKSRLPKLLKVDVLKLNFTAQGHFGNIKRFLVALEKVKPVININKIVFGFPNGLGFNEDEADVNASVTVSFFSIDLPKSLPSIETPLSQVSANQEDAFNQLLNQYKSFSVVNFQASQSAGPSNQVGKNNPFQY